MDQVKIKKEVLAEFRRYIKRGVKGKNSIVVIEQLMNKLVTDELIDLEVSYRVYLADKGLKYKNFKFSKDSIKKLKEMPNKEKSSLIIKIDSHNRDFKRMFIDKMSW